MNIRTPRFAHLVLFCASWFPLVAATSPERSTPSSDRTAKPAQTRAQVTRERVGNADYVLQPQDVLRVFVFQHDDINKQCEAVSISQEGTINLPLIQTVSVKGKTQRQAEELIRALYDKDYLVNPQVSVVVVKYAERFVNVLGAVNEAGRVPFPHEKGLTIVEAISLAGGPNRLADMKKVKLTRRTADGDIKSQEINVDAIIKNGGSDAVALEKDDTISVPERIL